jgi:hypothetical protein
MLIRCLQDHQVSQNETQHFEPGKVYDVPDELGRRLLNDFGTGSRHEARHFPVKFEKVADASQIEKAEADLAAAKAAQHDGEVIKVTPQGMVEPGESGAVDHTHLSDSEPQQQPPYGDKKLQAQGDAGTPRAGKGASGTAEDSKPATQRHGDTLSSDVGAKSKD